MDSFPRWNDDGDRQVLTFSNPGQPEVLEATVTPIGSFSLQTKTWLWAWANDSIPAVARERASEFQHLYQRTGMRVFNDRHFDCDEDLAWELTAAAVNQLGSLGCYGEPVGHLWIFVSIDSVNFVRRAN